MRCTTSLLLAVSLAFGGGFFNDPVDYFKDSVEKKIDKVNKKKDKQEYYKKIWEETMKWAPPNASPVERAYIQNPNDPVLREMVLRYLDQRTQAATLLSDYLQERISEREEVLKTLRETGVSFIYFFSPRCPYCKMSEPFIKNLSHKLKVMTVNIDSPSQEVKRMVEGFGVSATPTFVAMKNGKVMDVWVGTLGWHVPGFEEWVRNLAERVEVHK